MITIKSRIFEMLLAASRKTKIFDRLPYFFNNTLTVLNYHRIDDPSRNDFDTLKINVSASVPEFEKQVQYIKKHYNLITCEQLATYVNNNSPLPPRAAIITFDDGYYDNFSNAYPILKKHQIPAVIFLSTGFIEKDIPFYWDYAAYCFYHSKNDYVKLPVLGERHWYSIQEREIVLHEWIETVKKLPEADKKKAVNDIDTAFGISIPTDAFKGLHLNWQQVRELSQNGIEFGGHTVNHPILTRISLNEAREEIVQSKIRIEQEIQSSVISFAYPNGGENDFSEDIMRIVSEAGMPIAFSLLSGPTSYKTARRYPLSIRRIFMIHTDSFERFLLKVNGIARIGEMIRG